MARLSLVELLFAGNSPACFVLDASLVSRVRLATMRRPASRHVERCVTLLAACCLLLHSGCGAGRQAAIPPVADFTNRFEFTQPQMGLPFRIVLYAPDPAAAQTAARAAFARIQQLNDILSDYDTDSELSRLSRTAGELRPVPLSDDLWFVLLRAQQLAARSGGAFDVTVGPYVSLWRKARREKKLPRSDLLAEARAAVGWENLQLDPRARTAKLLVPGMRLDLGAIAKGYAVDQALQVLRARGISRALVAGGGDMVAGDAPPGKRGWQIEVAPLDITNAPPARFVWLANSALATSGDVFQHLDLAGRRYSHILDPKTGVGLTDHSLVTVIAGDCITADSLATAVSVLGPQRGLKLIEETRGTSVHIVRQVDDRIEMTVSGVFRN